MSIFPFGATYSSSNAAAHSLAQAQHRDLSNSADWCPPWPPIVTAMTEDCPIKKGAAERAGGRHHDLMEALEQGIEAVITDPMAQELYKGYKADAKAVERSMAAQSDTTDEVLQVQ
jgi:hypothetical protein